MREVELNTRQTANLWIDFSEKIGIDKIRSIYGKYWIRKKLKEERVWKVYDKDEWVGWYSLRPDPLDSNVWFIVGIFPGFQKKSYVSRIFKGAITKTFSVWPECNAMFFEIAKNSKFHQWELENIKKSNSVTEYAGEKLFPEPGSTIFMVKKRSSPRR
ncbi:hypothetical protein ES708_03951 [subsurface metagenome]